MCLSAESKAYKDKMMVSAKRKNIKVSYDSQAIHSNFEKAK